MMEEPRVELGIVMDHMIILVQNVGQILAIKEDKAGMLKLISQELVVVVAIMVVQVAWQLMKMNYKLLDMVARAIIVKIVICGTLIRLLMGMVTMKKDLDLHQLLQSRSVQMDVLIVSMVTKTIALNAGTDTDFI